MRWLNLWWNYTVQMLSNERGDTGGRKRREKEAKRQEDVARQREQSQNELNQFLAQLTPGSEEFNRLQTEGAALVQRTGEPGDQAAQIRSLGSQLVSEQQARIAAGGPATALEARTQAAFGGIREAAAFRPEEQAVFNALRGTPAGTELGQLFAGLVGRAGRPEETFETFTSTLPQQLALAQQQVAQGFARRGLSLSGLEVEGSQRVSNELAIREAQARQEARVQAQQERRASLQDVERLFNVGQQLRGREIGVEEALTNLQLGRESRLTELLGRQTAAGTENLLELFGARTTRAQDLRDVASALREAERQRTESFFLPEVTVGVPGAQAKFGGGGQTQFAAGTTPRTTGQAPTSVPSLLAEQQATQPPGGNFGTSLRRTQIPEMGDEAFQNLLRALSAQGTR